MPVTGHVFGFSLFVLPFHSINCVRPGVSCMLSSRSFVALHFVSAIHFEWSFVRGIRSVCGLVGRRGMVLVQNHLLKRLIALYVFTPW